MAILKDGAMLYLGEPFDVRFSVERVYCKYTGYWKIIKNQNIKEKTAEKRGYACRVTGRLVAADDSGNVYTIDSNPVYLDPGDTVCFDFDGKPISDGDVVRVIQKNNYVVPGQTETELVRYDGIR